MASAWEQALLQDVLLYIFQGKEDGDDDERA